MTRPEQMLQFISCMALEAAAAAAAKTTKTGLGSCIVNFLAVQKVVLFIILALKT